MEKHWHLEKHPARLAVTFWGPPGRTIRLLLPSQSAGTARLRAPLRARFGSQLAHPWQSYHRNDISQAGNTLGSHTIHSSPYSYPRPPGPRLLLGKSGLVVRRDVGLEAWEAGESFVEPITRSPSVSVPLSPSKIFPFENVFPSAPFWYLITVRFPCRAGRLIREWITSFLCPLLIAVGAKSLTDTLFSQAFLEDLV